MNRWSALALLLALAAAFALRVPKLDLRPLHNDEAVNAVKVSELWEHGRYVYDPHEYHGPTLHYFSLPFLWLSGARTSSQLTDATLRLAPVAFGVGLILLLLLFVDGLGWHAVVWAALFTAVSPAMVFYSRYFIHEMLLIFFTALALGSGWRYFQTRHLRWAIALGASVGLMSATKETFVLALAAMGIAGLVAAWWIRGRPSEKEANPGILWRHGALAILTSLVVWFLFFTSFFTNAHGPADSVRTYLPWIHRAGGHSPHIQPWNFYFERLIWFHPAKGPIWSELLILGLATVGILVSFLRRQPLQVFLACYTMALTVAYTAISYKTPWCLLGFWHGMILLAGVGAVALIELFRPRAVRVFVAVALAGLAGQLTWQAWRASFGYASDRRNPYVYAQTVPDALNLVRRLEGIAGVAPAGYATVVKVIAPDSAYWPLPWSLRRFQQVGWYDQLPADPYAPMVIVSAQLDARLDEKSERKWIMAGISELRPGTFLELYVELELWKRYVATLPRDGAMRRPSVSAVALTLEF